MSAKTRGPFAENPARSRQGDRRAELHRKQGVSRARRARSVTLASCTFIDEASEIDWGRVVMVSQTPVPHALRPGTRAPGQSRDDG